MVAVVPAAPGATLAQDRRARVHAALGDPHRLRIVDELAASDRSPGELATRLGIGTNLLAHHLGALEEAGVIERSASAGDRRRRYLRLVQEAVEALAAPTTALVARRVLFVCTANSARSQLAAAEWNRRHEVRAESAGTHPAETVHPEAVRAAARAGLDISEARPRPIEHVNGPDVVVTVCDVAHEELALPGTPVVHWSIPDPALEGTPEAFDDAFGRIVRRIERFAPTVRPPATRRSRR